MRLAGQFEQRTVSKEYFAIGRGGAQPGSRPIDLPIERIRTTARKWPSVAIMRRAEAQTFYEVAERFDGFSAVVLQPKTGRTHQIRLHLASIDCPVLCDRFYGGRARDHRRGELSRDPADQTVLLARQALHARRLAILAICLGGADGVCCAPPRRRILRAC